MQRAQLPWQVTASWHFVSCGLSVLRRRSRHAALDSRPLTLLAALANATGNAMQLCCSQVRKTATRAF